MPTGEHAASPTDDQHSSSAHLAFERSRVDSGFDYWYRKYEVLGDIPSFDDRRDLEGFEKHRNGKASPPDSFSLHTAARDLVVRSVGGKAHNRQALELLYR